MKGLALKFEAHCHDWLKDESAARGLIITVAHGGINLMTMSLTEVQDKIQKGEYRLSDHAIKRMIKSQMKCVFCGSKVESRNVTFVYDFDGDYFFIENVPAEVCEQCGEKTYAPAVTDELLRLAKKKLKPSKTVQVPVFDYALQGVAA